MQFRCDAAAPLVANGGGFVGCSLDKGHDGQHEATIRWDGTSSARRCDSETDPSEHFGVQCDLRAGRDGPHKATW